MHVDFINRVQQVVDYFHDGKDINLAKAVGISANSVHKLKRGITEPKFSTLKKIAEVSSISLDWLINGEGEMSKPNQRYIEKYNGLPSFEEQTGYSKNHNTIDQIDNHQDRALGITHTYVIPSELFQEYSFSQDAKKIKTYRVKGDSMEPTLRSGALVILDVEVDKLFTGSIYLVRIDDEISLRRVNYLNEQEVELSFDNSYYNSTEIDIQSNKLRILGKLLYSCKAF